MRDSQIVIGFQHHDQAINKLRSQVNELGKNSDRMYLRSLTHEMMWDVLLGLLNEKGIFTKEQFDQSLQGLAAKTKLAMEEADKMATAGKTTVLSDVPAIPVVK